MTLKTYLRAKLPLQLLAVIQAARISVQGSLAPMGPSAGASNADLGREFRVFSQNGEDGILEHIYSQIGFTDRRFCEFGFSIFECNALYLVRRHGFRGRWIDYDPETCRAADLVVRLLRWNGIEVVNSGVTKDNVNELVGSVGGSHGSTIDLLSIDVDGVDYWLFETLTAIRPRVLVMEYNAVFGPDLSVTVPYQPYFNRFDYHPDGYYFGASLRALEKLAAAKGYRLLGVDRTGMNAFFLENSIAAPSLPTRAAKDCWQPMGYWVGRGRDMKECFATIAKLPLVEV